MKKFLYILSLFVFSSCISGGGYVTFDKCEFYEISREDSEVIYYISYPQAGSIEEGDGVLTMDYLNCSVEFGEGLNYKPDPNDFIEIKTHEGNGVSYQAWYKEDLLVRYGGSLANYDYKFWLSDFEGGVSDCILVLETMAESFTDTPFYHNKDYGFKIDLLPDYKMEYLPSGEGVLMKKWVEENMCTDEFGEEYECGYKVEIYVFASENVMGYQNLAEFLANKYSGYSAEFVNFGEDAGVFIDEGSGEDAIRHYFMMGEGTGVVYEAYLKVPSVNYSAHKEEFDELVVSFEIL
ncbi:MAG: hypothetical protein ABID64_04100 [Nitrospirota bacterium]